MAKLVFITGASSGIGRALAMRYYEAGYSLALVARRTAEIDGWVADAGLVAERCGVYGADVSLIDSIICAGRACVERQGVPDVVIANAGISVGVDTAVRADIDVLARILATNNTGMVATFHPFLEPMMQRRSGTLVGISSVAGIRGFPGHGGYCSSKAAVISYCESLRGELRTTGLKVVTICPGYVDTPLTRGNRYPMPFLMDPAVFAAKAFAAVEAGVSYRVIPWQMGLVAWLLRLMPNFLFDKAIAGRPRKRRSGQ